MMISIQNYLVGYLGAGHRIRVQLRSRYMPPPPPVRAMYITQRPRAER